MVYLGLGYGQFRVKVSLGLGLGPTLIFNWRTLIEPANGLGKLAEKCTI